MLTIDFHNKVMYSDLLKLIENNYSLEMKDDPTRYKVGLGLGIAFHVIFGLSFVALCIMMIADLENLWVIVILGTTMQRLFMILLTNWKPSELLASFWTHFGVVSFKTVYFEALLETMIDEGEIAMSGHYYNSLGWFGFDSAIIVSNSSGSLSLLLIVIFLWIAFSSIVGLMKLIRIKGKWMDRLMKMLNFLPQILIILQQLILNDIALSVFLNIGSLDFSNNTKILSSWVWLIWYKKTIFCK